MPRHRPSPIIFYKAPNTVVGPYDDVLIPRGSTKTDWEVELAVVIGRPARYLDSPADALGARRRVRARPTTSPSGTSSSSVSGGQWSKGKSCETFNPLGPWLVTADEIGDPQALRLRSWVNGEPRQDSSTTDMIFDVAYLVWHLSPVHGPGPGRPHQHRHPAGRGARPAGSPTFAAGDVMEVEIDGLGRQRQHAPGRLMRCDGLVAVVTGGASGIGLACVRAFAAARRPGRRPGPGAVRAAEAPAVLGVQRGRGRPTPPVSAAVAVGRGERSAASTSW